MFQKSVSRSLVEPTSCARPNTSWLTMTFRPKLPESLPPGFTLKSAVLEYERRVIEVALRQARGSVSHAAKLLGYKHHQTFVATLNMRHKDLAGARNPVVPRNKALFKRPRR